MWMVLGERLSEGYLLYVDVIDDTGPLSAGVFTGLHLLFGRSPIAYILLGKIIVLVQIYYWNSTLIKYRVFDENTYLPAIVMAALFHFSFDLMYLSPTLLGSTFLLLAFGQLFSHTVLQKESSESTLLIGIYGGLATGFHWNFVFFLPFIVFTGLAISLRYANCFSPSWVFCFQFCSSWFFISGRTAWNMPYKFGRWYSLTRIMDISPPSVGLPLVPFQSCSP